MRLHRPIPIILLLLPIYVALWIAHPGAVDFKITLIFTLGGVVMRSAGCVANDIADRRIDPYVSRTKMRPLAGGEVSLKEAVWVLVILLFFALILVLCLNTKTFLYSFIALGLALFYPLTKRFFILPQLVLGLTYNFGIVMAFTVFDRPFSWAMLWLYGGSVLWTLAYDTFYALCDITDDRRIGIHSSAVFFGPWVYPAIALLQALTLYCWIAMGLEIQAGLFFYGMLLACLFIFAYQHYVSRVKHEHLYAFGPLNVGVGVFLLCGIVIN